VARAEQDKLTHFTLTHRIRARICVLIRSEDSETVRYFPDKLPIGVDLEGAYTFIYIVTRPGPVDFVPSWSATPNCCARFELDDSPLVHGISRGCWGVPRAFREQLACAASGNLGRFALVFHARQAPRSSENAFDQAARRSCASVSRSVPPGRAR